jgi:hypothetical protein
MDEEELKRRTNPIIMVLERRQDAKEWSSAQVMRILRKRAVRKSGATAATAIGHGEPED